MVNALTLWIDRVIAHNCSSFLSINVYCWLGLLTNDN